MSRVKWLSVYLLYIFLLMRVSIFADEYPIPKYPYDITTADVDCDGDQDLIVGSTLPYTMNDTISIFYNKNGNFTLNYINEANAHDLRCVNIDEDNFPDLVTKVVPNYVYYHNNGDGSFSDSIAINPTSDYEEILISDTNNDGDNDIVFYGYEPMNSYGYWGILHNNGYGEFTENLYFETEHNLMCLDAGIINEDEYADIVLNTGDATPPRIFYNTGSGFVQDTLMVRNWGQCFIKDMNNDTLNDLFFFIPGNFIGIPCDFMIGYNRGNEEFTYGDTLELPPLSTILDIADYNNDDYPDIIYHSVIFDSQNQSDEENIFICFNNQDGTFSDSVMYHIGPCMFGFKLTSADFDNNGYLDIAVTSRDLYHVRILFNDGTGNFTDEPQFCIDEENEFTQSINNYPNPFHNTTTISFSVRGQAVRNTRVMIYNSKGQFVKELKNITQFDSFNYFAQWNGKNDTGKEVKSGVYLYRLQSDDGASKTKKMILMKND